MADSGMDGLLVIDKPGLGRELPRAAGVDLSTSHDVVQRVRRCSRQRRIGHTGTLDPMASGVLVLCLGVATRLVEYYQGHDKVYTACVTLGATTDTYDALGEIIARRPVSSLKADAVEDVLARFRGEIAQRPPVYSALKQGGESLHRKARRGEDVIVQARPVTVHRLELLSIEAPDRLWLRVACSAGFYVRSLAYDVGEALGVGGHLSYLRREAAGHFSVADAHPLAAVESAAREGNLASLLLAPGVGLDLPRLLLNGEDARRLGLGQRVWLPFDRVSTLRQAQDTAGSTCQLRTPPGFASALVGGVVQAVDDDGHLLGIVRVLEESTESGGGLLCKAEKWLAPQTHSD
ncbi:MAG: tRNA pseudouridine(55) synthase TruB [Chloroflexi bacterium]|nr:tRNA pseudouridine(55) synthase TruB [Chloroflexota bacterium]